MKAALYDEVPLPSKLKVGYPKLLEKVVMKALERDRDKRWETMQSFADALEESLIEEASVSSASQVGAWMCGAFEERRNLRDEILRTPYREDSSIPADDSSKPTPIGIDRSSGRWSGFGKCRVGHRRRAVTDGLLQSGLFKEARTYTALWNCPRGGRGREHHLWFAFLR